MDVFSRRFVFIVSAGRSGSRLVAEIFQRSGLFVLHDGGADHSGNQFECRAIERINAFIDARRYELEYRVEGEQGREGIRQWFADHLEATAASLGWAGGEGPIVIKDPRILYLLDTYHALFPRAHFVHVVRDGRDYGVSKIAESRARGEPFMSPDFLLQLWNLRMGLVASARGEPWFHELRFEDLVREPVAEMEALFRNIGLDATVRVPHTDQSRIGRFRRAGVAFTPAVLEQCAYLRHFGYMESEVEAEGDRPSSDPTGRAMAHTFRERS